MEKFWRLLSYAKPYRWKFFWLLILGIFASSFQPGAVVALKPFIEGIMVKRDPYWIKIMPVIVVGFTIFCAICRYFYTIWVTYLSEKMVQEIRLELYKVYTSLSFDYYSKASSGKMMSVIASDVVMLLEGYGKIDSLFRDPFTIAGLLAVAFYRNWKMTLLSLVLMPPLIYLVTKIGKKLRKMTGRRQEGWAVLNATVHETLSGIRIAKAFNLEHYLQKRFRKDNEDLLAIQWKWIKIEKLTGPLLAVLGGIGFAFFANYGGNQIFSAHVNGIDLLSVGIAFGLLIDPVKKINALNVSFQKALGAADRIFAMMDLKPAIVDASQAIELKSFSKEIRFSDVSFKYDTEPVLQGIDLSVKKGEVIAFVGSSGAGKTTLVNLIPRFYDVSSGSILIDDMDVRRLTMASLRNQISIVAQDVFLFNDTLSANISYGKLETSRLEIIEAAKAAYAHEFIMRLPLNYDTIIGERGVKLSGGQRQRISIARALLKNAPILILDEATSALDTESEVLVQEAIEQLMEGRTCFIIAHRLSTIQHADRIIVLDKGRIVEEGTHPSLLERNGSYAHFYQLQFSQAI